MTGSGLGHANGQYVGETAMRMRWPGVEGVRDRAEAHDDLVAASRLERLGRLVGVAVGEVEEAAGDEQRRARRRDVADAHRAESERPVGSERELRLGEAEDLHPLGQRLRREAERTPVLGPLVAGVVARRAPAAPRPGVHARQLRAGDRALGLVARVLAENTVGSQMEHVRRPVARRPDGLRHPAAGALGVPPGGRIDPLLQVDAQAGPVERAVLLRLEAVIPEAQALLQEADRRAGRARLRVEVTPGPDEAPWPAPP